MAGYAAGQNSYATGFARTTPSARYNNATAVRGNFNAYGAYGQSWYAAHPGAWSAAGWTAGAAWTPATWSTAGAWRGFASAPPLYYDYGNNVTYQNNDVYVNGQSAGTAAQYYDQAETLAQAGTAAAAPSDGQWLPLGVFSFSKSDQSSSNTVIQLALNKDGVLRGNYTDNTTGQTQPIHGSVDKSSQRVAFTIGDNTETVVETGLYNLTKDEAPALMHFGADRTEQWLLVRVESQGGAAGQ
jgi:hypothetical protein